MAIQHRSILAATLPVVSMQNFLNTDTPGYPVGVWNVNDIYLGTAANQSAVAILWNADPSNQAVGQIYVTSSPTKFYFQGTTPPARIRGLRYYMYKGPANIQIFVGANDIIKYGSTTKTGGVDGVVTNSDTRREWNRYLFGTAFKTTIPTTNVRLLACTGYTANSNLYVFHNEDTEYWGVSFSFGFYYIEGAAPIATKAVGAMAGQFTTDYNLVTNWNELTSLWSFCHFHSGGGPWYWDNPAYFPNLPSNQITQLHFGELNTTLNSTAYFINQTNYPNVSELVFRTNSGDILAGSESWFLNMPKVNKYLSYSKNTATQNTTVTADLVWNNTATNLTGITPVIGSQAELAIRRTSNVSAASLASRTYLAAQGWTVILN